MGAIFAQYPAASWKVAGRGVIVFPVTEITETGGQRIVVHERPYRDGGKLDATGMKPRAWSFRACFSNRLEEPGTEANPHPLYPEMLRQLIRSFAARETGTLTLPTIGQVRARAQDYGRREAPEDDDAAWLDLTFTEDNEDSLDRTEFLPPTVSATLVKLAELTTFSAERDGVWNDDMQSLRETASELEGLMRAPGRSAADVGAVARAHRRVLQSLVQTASEEGPGRLRAGDAPRSTATERLLAVMLDREAQAEEERTFARPRTKAFVVDVEQTSLYEIAARLDQDVEQLLELNAARVADPFDLTRGEVIRVFEAAS